jgi:predicted integral membrane protein DUF2269
MAILWFQLWKFVHLVGVFGFLLTHGVSAGVALKLRKERDRGRIDTLIQFSGSTIKWFYVSLAILLLGGIAGGVSEHAWGQRWIWAAVIVLFLASAAMWGMARGYYVRIKDKLRIRASGVPQASDEEIDEILGGPRPVVIAAIGFVALIVLLWLMVYKPKL